MTESFPILVTVVVVIDAVLGFVTSVRTLSAVLRFFTWLAITFGIAYLVFITCVGGGSGGESGLSIISLVAFVAFGLVATGVGSLLGYYVRRKKIQKRDTGV